MVLCNFNAWEKDTRDMPFSSPSGLPKKQLDSVVIEEANKQVSKFIMSTGIKQSYTSSESYHCKVCSRTFVSNFSFIFSAFSKVMTPVTIYTYACACLTVVLRCPYILGLGWASTRETRSNSQPQMFSSELDLILHPQKSTMNNLPYTVVANVTCRVGI